jgi:excisionase family DNA binding protein
MGNEGKYDDAPLTMEEASAYLGLSKGYLYKLTSSGRIPNYKPAGGRLYFTLKDLNRYLFRNRRATEFEIGEGDFIIESVESEEGQP